jgi:P2 family phage contractile tail tube protein
MISIRPFPVTHFNLFIDGYGLGAKVEDLTLPKITVKTEDMVAGGLDGVLVSDMGIEKLEAEFTLLDYDPFILGKLGFAINGGPKFHVRGAMKRDGLPAIPLVAKFEGMITEFDPGNWKAGDKKVLKMKMVASYYELSIGGKEIYLIDVPNMRRVINGIDQIADVRAAIMMV